VGVAGGVAVGVEGGVVRIPRTSDANLGLLVGARGTSGALSSTAAIATAESSNAISQRAAASLMASRTIALGLRAVLRSELRGGRNIIAWPSTSPSSGDSPLSQYNARCPASVRRRRTMSSVLCGTCFHHASQVGHPTAEYSQPGPTAIG
jgi:hypothetical protein